VKLRLRAVDSSGRSAAVVRSLIVSAPTLRVTELRAPNRVRHLASRVAVRIATSAPATVRAGGRSYRVGGRARTLQIPLPARPRSGVLRIKLAVTALGSHQRALPVKLLVFRP
jgi:hypothetical protein